MSLTLDLTKAEVLQTEATEQYTRLLNANSGRICGFIFTLVHDFDATQDLLQEVSLVLWRKFEDFDPSTDFAVWAMSVARLSVFEWRRTRRHALVELDSEEFALLADEAVAVALESDERKAALRQCLAKLDEADRALLAARYEQKQSAAEIAAHMEVSPVAIYKRLNKLYSLLLDCIRRRQNSEHATL